MECAGGVRRAAWRRLLSCASGVMARVVFLALLVLAACSGAGEERVASRAMEPARAAAGEARAPVPSPILPRDAPAFSPAQIDVGERGAPRGDVLADVDTCEGCHADAAEQWRTSAHAFASFNNPAYRFAVERFRADVGKTQSHFCAGCHDVSLLVDGAMDREIDPRDVRGHTGVACRICHGIVAARPDGNGSFTLRTDPLPLPKKNDAESLRAHKAEAAQSTLRESALCGSCHRSFLGAPTGNPAHLTGMDELSGWSQSIYAGSLLARIDEPLAPQTCRDCHMPKEAAPLGDAAAKEGRIASHRFMGGHTWLAAMRGDAKHLARARERLAGVVSVDVASVLHDDGARDLLAESVALRAGDALTLDVVVRNLGVGHRFPGGTLDAQDAWVELTIRDARGRLLAEAGTQHEKSGDDETAHRFRAVQADENGEPQLARETHHFRAVVYNHTIAPRDAEVVRYLWEVPSRVAAPLRVTARVRHRSRNLVVARAACAEGRLARGAVYSEASKRLVGQSADACAIEPVTDLAVRDVWIGPGAASRGAPDPSTPPAWRRLYDHALGLLHGPQERIEEARPSLTRAAALADTPLARAMVASLFAQVAVAEGRTSEAMEWLERAAKDAPGHPAIAAIRGEALASVWRWDEAAAPLRDCTRAAPNDSAAWSRFAIASGSRGDALAALDAAAHGLALAPRDADMLRVQALALEQLGGAASEVSAAKEAYVRYKSPDDAPRIRSACAKRVVGCGLERIPVHVHTMRRAP